MEGWTVGVLVALIGVVGFFVGQRMSGKNETLHKQAKWYEEELSNMRTEVKRYRARASYFQKGAIPSELGHSDGADALVDGIMQALPPNFRQMISPFKGEILKYAKDNPEVVNQIVEVAKSKLNQEGGEKVAQSNSL